MNVLFPGLLVLVLCMNGHLTNFERLPKHLKEQFMENEMLC